MISRNPLARSMYVAALISMLSGTAWATHKPDPHAPAGNQASAQAVAQAAASARGGNAEADQRQGQAQQASSDQTQAQQANASNDGNSQSVNSYGVRNAPSLGQGSLVIGDCGAGVNGGGSNTHGAGFLGIVWTPRDCKLLQAASAYAALGMVDAACDMVNGVSAVKARYTELGISPPDCHTHVIARSEVIEQVPVEAPAYVTQAEMQVAVDRAFRRSVAK